MPAGGMPRPSEGALAAFQSLVPDVAGVTARPMFGNRAAFVNGNMFAGLFGDALFVRVDSDGRQRLLAEGGSDFEPMPGRPMRGYTCLAPGWELAVGPAREWVDRALTYVAALPPKSGAPRGRGGAKAPPGLLAGWLCSSQARSCVRDDRRPGVQDKEKDRCVIEEASRHRAGE